MGSSWPAGDRGASRWRFRRMLDLDRRGIRFPIEHHVDVDIHDLAGTAVSSCAASELCVSVFGTSGAAGTALLGIDLARVSAVPCSLKGVPRVESFGRGGPPANDVRILPPLLPAGSPRSPSPRGRGSARSGALSARQRRFRRRELELSHSEQPEHPRGGALAFGEASTSASVVLHAGRRRRPLCPLGCTAPGRNLADHGSAGPLRLPRPRGHAR